MTGRAQAQLGIALLIIGVALATPAPTASGIVLLVTSVTLISAAQRGIDDPSGKLDGTGVRVREGLVVVIGLIAGIVALTILFGLT